MKNIHSFTMGNFSVDVTFTLSEKCVQDEEDVSIYSGVIGIIHKGVSFFVLKVTKCSSFFRIDLQLKTDESCNYETVNHNTSVRLSQIPNPVNRLRCSTSSDDTYDYNFHLDQLHILKKFQRKGCGTKLMALILFWMRMEFPRVHKCFVISPSAIGSPFYLSVGALNDLSSRNLVFKL
jgi:hypothetical protein